MAAEEASPFRGETFRQKDWKTDHILNLVLYDKAFLSMADKRQEGRTYAHGCVVRRPFLYPSIP